MAFSYNYVLASGAASWAAAQVIKTLLYTFTRHTFKAERLIGSGGMPSSHSALVTSALVATGIHNGVESTEFALAFILAMIVMYDAMGVRRAAGLHAQEINRMNRLFDFKFKDLIDTESEESSKKRKELKEFLGHNPLEVFVGAVLGVIIALVMPR